MAATRILYVITDLNTGGVPLHLFRLALAVREQGFAPHVVSLAPVGEVGVTLADAGIGVQSCQARGPADVLVIGRLARLMRRVRPALVHSFLFHGNIASQLACVLAGISPHRLICEIQTVEIARRWHVCLGGMTHRLCRVVVGNSPSVVRHLHDDGGIAWSRLRCLPGGVPVDAYARAVPADRAELGVKAGESVLLWVGRLDPVKGLDELLAAFAQVRQRVPARLVLAGEGAYRVHLVRTIEALALRDHVALLGTRTDIPSLMRAADLFVFPSRAEGMPNALLEAMAASLPIVTTDAPGCRDLIEHGRTGWRVPVGDAAALRDGIVQLLADHDLASKLGTEAARVVEARYSQRVCTERCVRLYRETLPAGHGRRAEAE